MEKAKAMLWQQRIQECMSSDFWVKRWCKEKHVLPTSLYYWKNSLEKEPDETPEKQCLYWQKLRHLLLLQL